MDVTQEIINLTAAVNTLSGVQSEALKNSHAWQGAHDERAKSTLAAIEKSIEKLSDKILAMPCAEQRLALVKEQESTKQRFISAEKRINWVWGAIGAAFLLKLAEYLIK